MRKRYSTDLTDKQWAIIKPFIPPEKNDGRPRTTDMREVVKRLSEKSGPAATSRKEYF